MSPTPKDPEEFTDVDALQDALRAEHAAVYGYAYIGAHSEDGRRERCYGHLDAHRVQRDALRAELVDREATPVAGESAYELPESTEDDELAAFATRLEEQTAQSYLQLAAAEDAPLRDLAARSLQAATVRGLVWGAEPAPFPGFPDGDVPAADTAGGD
ncbi:MAG: ferritin-like domain-containing protein [Nocardiopsaceae bacterium]|nr:ferritin-like domain-containing protein [Nocardiopsaceae bacterium]